MTGNAAADAALNAANDFWDQHEKRISMGNVPAGSTDNLFGGRRAHEDNFATSAININVAGSVVTENDLARIMNNALYNLQKSGLAVGYSTSI